jgi:Peptidase A4 family
MKTYVTLLRAALAIPLTIASARADPPVPTNVPGIRAFVAPPSSFDPVAATPQVLQQYGFPPKPDSLNDPEAYKNWFNAVTHRQVRLTNVTLKQTTRSNGPIKLLGKSNGNIANPNASAQSQNWSGFVDVNETGLVFKGLSYINAYWIVPIAQPAFGSSGDVYSSQWVGFDGWSSADVLQAGTEADFIGGSPNYDAWIEWYPNYESAIGGFSVSPGDVMFVEVWNSSSTVGNAYLADLTNNTAVSFQFDAPLGTSLVGDSAEWIFERPGVGGSFATLTNYIATAFHACTAYASVGGGTYNRPYYPATGGNPSYPALISYNVTMLDNNDDPISTVILAGSGMLWFSDEGSSL